MHWACALCNLQWFHDILSLGIFSFPIFSSVFFFRLRVSSSGHFCLALLLSVYCSHDDNLRAEMGLAEMSRVGL